MEQNPSENQQFDRDDAGISNIDAV